MSIEEPSLPHWSHVVNALAALVFTWLFVSFASSIQRKIRVAKGLEPVLGPKGTFLLGILPEIAANMSRFYDFQVRVLLVILRCDHVYTRALVLTI